MSRLKQSQYGITLIEILVSIVIFAIGLLGVAALQIVGLKNTHSSSLHTQATTSATDILDRMRINRSAALAGDYDIALSASAPSVITIAGDDLRGWKTDLIGQLPSGDGAIDCSTVAGLCVVTVRWDDSRATAGNAAAVVALRGRL
jgi:type IV pilus assembly protein PilV